MTKKPVTDTGKEDTRFTITGKAYWAHVRKINPITIKEEDKNSGKYTLDLSVSDEVAKELKSKGVTVKNKPDKQGNNERGNFVSLSRNAILSDGEELAAPKVVDSKGNEVPATILIGNGSLVKVVTSLYKWSYPPKKPIRSGTSLNLRTIQVLELVEYVGGTHDTDLLTEETSGYVSTKTSSGSEDELLENDGGF